MHSDCSPRHSWPCFSVPKNVENLGKLQRCAFFLKFFNLKKENFFLRPAGAKALGAFGPTRPSAFGFRPSTFGLISLSLPPSIIGFDWQRNEKKGRVRNVVSLSYFVLESFSFLPEGRFFFQKNLVSWTLYSFNGNRQKLTP